MDQSTHQVSHSLPLDRFAVRALSELQKLAAAEDHCNATEVTRAVC